MKRLFKTLFAIVIVIAVIIISAAAIASVKVLMNISRLASYCEKEC